MQLPKPSKPKKEKIDYRGSQQLQKKVKDAVQFIRSRTQAQPKIAIVLGSGLGTFADCLQDKCIIPYSQIPHFKVTTVQGHEGNLVFGRCNGTQVIAMKGRHHFYEGKGMEDIILPIAVFKQLSVEYLIVSNASGGVNDQFRPGQIIVIKDHINYQSQNSLIKQQDELVGCQFPDMTNLYRKKLRELVKECMRNQKMPDMEGTYMALTGPSFETPAEIKMAEFLGADLVGMSSVPEAIFAHAMQIKVIGLSLVSNMAAGKSQTKLSGNDVIDVAKLSETKFVKLVVEVIFSLNKKMSAKQSQQQESSTQQNSKQI